MNRSEIRLQLDSANPLEKSQFVEDLRGMLAQYGARQSEPIETQISRENPNSMGAGEILIVFLSHAAVVALIHVLEKILEKISETRQQKVIVDLLDGNAALVVRGKGDLTSIEEHLRALVPPKKQSGDPSNGSQEQEKSP